MKVLFYVSPFEVHGIPLNYAHGAVSKLPGMAAGLKSFGARVEVLTSAHAARVMRARDAEVFRSCDKLWLMNDADIAALGPGSDTGVAGADLFTAATPDEKRLRRARRLMERLGMKDDPDHVISMFSETDFFRLLFPGSLVTFFETGLVSHLPFQQFHVFDPVGTYRKDAWFTGFSDTALLKQAEALNAYAPILDRIREGFGRFSERFIGDLGGPKAIRGNFRKLVLVPLQVMGNPSVDRTVEFSSPFQFLEHVLRRLPPDIGAVVSEHPVFPQITAKQHAYLQEAYDNYVFSSQQQQMWSPSAVMLPVVDAVIGISSTVLLQAHALGVRTYSVGTSSFAHLNQEPHLEAFVAALSDDRPFRDRRLAVLNMVSRYSAPMSLYTTPWLGERLAQTRRPVGTEAEKPVVDLPFIAAPEALATEYAPRAWPAKLEKPSNFFMDSWDGAPLSLHRSALPAPKAAETGVAGGEPHLRVAVVLDHYAVGGTQRVVQRLIDLMPDVEWVLFVEKLVEDQFPLRRNARIVSFERSHDTEEWAENLCRAMYRVHAKTPISLFLDPMHWRPGAVLSAAKVRKVLGIPVIYWEHNSYFFPLYNGLPDLHRVRESILGEVDHTVVLSPRDRAHFAAARPDLPVTVIANPVPEISSDAGNTTASKTILVLGRFDPQKRMDRLVPIMKSFHPRHPAWKMVVLGDGAARGPLMAQASREGLDKVMSFPGYCPDPEPYLRQAAVVAIVSDYEGDPLVIMEAKAHGLPVVAFELFQNTRLRDGLDGYYIAQGDIDGFVDRLSALAGSAELRHRLGEAGRAHYRSYDNREVARTWRALFDAVIAGTATGTPCETTLEHGELLREAVHVMASQAWKMDEMSAVRMQSLRAELAKAKKVQRAEEALQADLAALEKDRLQLRQREEELATAVSRARARADAEAKKARKLQQAYVGQRARGDKLERAYRQSPRYLASRIYRWVLSWRRPANGK